MGEGWVREELDFALNTVRAALGSRLMEERARGSFREAAEIQQSLLLDELPEFPGYELAARSVPTEEVGGDFFDFIPFDGEMLGLAIGDASGHGLPAALLVRDLVTGLRMGIERELKVAPVLTKLNRVIHRSRLSSRFVSVFYGELEASGNLIYVNAGHQPPLLFSRGREHRPDVDGNVFQDRVDRAHLVGLFPIFLEQRIGAVVIAGGLDGMRPSEASPVASCLHLTRRRGDRELGGIPGRPYDALPRGRRRYYSGEAGLRFLLLVEHSPGSLAETRD